MNVTTRRSSGASDPAPSPPPADPFRDLRWVSSGLGLLTVLTLLLIWWYGYVQAGWRFQPQVLWALAIWCAGAGLGFLFAIPRVLQGQGTSGPPLRPASPNPAPTGAPTPLVSAAMVYEQRVNTNLEEISDWLTKIIVGMTLVQLNQIPSLVTRLATQVVADLPGSADGKGASRHLGYATALIIAFFILGFLFGYLVTRLYLQGALARAERGLSDEGRLELERRAVTAETAAELLSNVTVMPASVDQGAVAPPPQVQTKLHALAEEYRSVNIADWGARTAAKNRLAAALFQVVVSEGVSRDWLATQDDEALILALASTVHAIPAAGDAARLLKVAHNAKLKHVRYRIATAFGRLLESGLVPADVQPDIKAVLTKYLVDADPPLVDVVRAVLNQLDQRAR